MDSLSEMKRLLFGDRRYTYIVCGDPEEIPFLLKESKERSTHDVSGSGLTDALVAQMCAGLYAGLFVVTDTLVEQDIPAEKMPEYLEKTIEVGYIYYPVFSSEDAQDKNFLRIQEVWQRAALNIVHFEVPEGKVIYTELKKGERVMLIYLALDPLPDTRPSA